MPLSEDQKAMLKLVSQPDTSYEDIAALMGLSVDEVRAKVDDALRQLDAGAEAAKPAEPEPEPPAEPAEPPAASRVDPAPARQTGKAPPKKAASPRPSLKLPEDKGARYAILAGGAVVLLLVLLLVTGVLGDDDEGSGGGSDAGAGTVAAAEGGQEQGDAKTPTQAVLDEVDGSGASGQALFGRAGQQVVLLVRVKGLDPAPSGQSYTVSIGKSEDERVPLIASRPNRKGEVVGSFKIAPQILGLLASGYDRMEVSLVPNDELSQALKAAQKSGTAPAYGGTALAAGDVSGPIVEAGEAEAEGG